MPGPVSPAHFAARHQILNTLALHSRGVDRADAGMMGAAYHEGAGVDYGFFAGPAAQLVTMLCDAQAGTPPTLHRTSNCWIEVSGDTAVSESYVTAYVEEAETQRLVFGRYLDRHECRGGEWRLIHRQYLLEGNGNYPTSVARPAAQHGFEHYLPQGAKRGCDAGRAILAHFHAKGCTDMSAETQVESAALNAALARAEIHDLTMAYCRGVDRGDDALIRSIFTDDAIVSLGITNGTASQFATDITAFVAAGPELLFHSVANEWVDVRGDHAVGEHYAIAALVIDGTETLTGGRYLDRYEKRGGRWLIAERAFITDWTSTRPSTMEKAGFYESLPNWGRKDRSDPVYALWEGTAA